MFTYFISDLHLCAERQSVSDRFLRFLNEEAQDADSLYILGDLFESWVGDDQINAHDQSIIDALAQAHQQGLPLYFMHGNRDFLINQIFATQSGCALLKDPTLITLYGHSILLMHGDTLCTHDKPYQRFRKIVRSACFQQLFQKLPFSLRTGVARFMRNRSTRSTPQSQRTPRYYDVALDSVYQTMRHYQCQTLIHGHTHKPGIANFILDQMPATRIVLGDWHDTGAVVLVYGTDGPRLKTLV